jgi:hypothetical protein
MSDGSSVWQYVGAISGGVATIISLVSAVRVSRMKALDLRVEMRKLEEDTARIVDGLPGALDATLASHSAVTIATHGVGSGNFIAWRNGLDTDRAQAQTLIAEFQGSRRADYHDHSNRELEDQLITMHALNGKLASLRDKYAASIAADDRMREEIRATSNALAIARTGGAR